MTICIAALCRWGYKFDDGGKPTEVGTVVVTASDRMLTAEKYGIEYEPNQMKRTSLGATVELLVADDIVIHSVKFRSFRNSGRSVRA